MSARSKARKRALDVLYESELRGLPVGGTLADRQAAEQPPLNEYTVRLVEGVAAHHEQIDELIAGHAKGWVLERMPPVDRNILRVAVYELLHEPDVPEAVAISEAVALARELSTDESPGFVNGLLSAVATARAGTA